MKFLLVSLLCVLSLSLSAQAVEYSRSLTQIGGFVTVGNDAGLGAPGWGASIRSFTFFDPQKPDGFYFGILGSAMARSIGNEGLADVRLVTLGYRKFVFGGVQLDASASPTLGSRSSGNLTLGSLYTGIGLTLGMHVAVSEGNDVGISWEPVIPLTSWGDPRVPNQGYQDFMICWTTKVATQVTKLPW